MSEIILDLPGDRTDLYARTRKMVRDAYETLYREKLEPWRFFYAKPLQCTDCRGNPIRYGGVKFKGSPRDVFWGGFIEPCLEDITVQVLDTTALNCQKGHLKPEAYLKEAADLLGVFVRKVYEYMVRTDQVLLGEGFPDRIKPRDITAKVAAMNQLITGHLRATLITQPATDIHSEHLEVHKRIKDK